MLAARLHEYGKPFQLDQVPDPEPGPGEVRVRIGGAGACHSDIHIRHGEIPGLPPMPRILGHENAGWVDALGPGATGFEPGEPVVVYGGWGCGQCRFCLGGQEQMCDTLAWGGLGPSGGYAEYLVVPGTRHLVRIGDLDPTAAAPLTDAGLTPYRAVRKVEPSLIAGSSAFLIGAGGLGQMAVQLVKLLTPARAIVADISAEKRQAALDLGADAAVDPADGDAVEQIMEATGGEGAAAVLDLVGTDETLALAAASIGRQSTVVVVGLAGGSVPFGFFTWPPEAVLTSSNWGSRNELQEVVALARAGLIQVRVERSPLEQINDVFARLEQGQIGGRAVLVPGMNGGKELT
jgi:alcohol dehydrogenase, propanol-preferring